MAFPHRAGRSRMHHDRRIIGVISFLAAGFLLVIATAAADRQQGQITDQVTPGISNSPAGISAPAIQEQQLEGILGKAVRTSADEDMGRIVDVLVNHEGQLRAVVIDFGGFLGVGSRKVAVDWSALHFSEAGKADRVTLELTRDQVRLAPEYKPGEPVRVVGVQSQSSPNASPLSEK